MGRNLGPLNIKDTYEGLVQISGSQLTDGSGSLIPSLEVTASHASNADVSISASYAQTSTSSSHALVADLATTASYVENAVSASYALTATSASHAVNSDTAVSSSYAATATSSSYATTATNANHASTATLATTASHALTSDTAISSSYAVTASYSENATTPTLDQVLTQGSSSTKNIILQNTDVSGGIKFQSSGFPDTTGSVYQDSGALILQVVGNGSPGPTSPDIVFKVSGSIVADFDASTINLLQDTQATTITGTAITASAGFKGNLAGTASYSDTSQIYGDATNAERLLIFVNDNPATGASQAEQLRGDTSKSIKYNPFTNTLTVPNTVTTASYATQALSSSYAITASYAENAGGGGGLELWTTGSGTETVVGKMASSGSNASPQGFLFGSGSSITTTGKSAVILGAYNSTLGGLGYGSAIIGGGDITVSGNYGSGTFTSQASTNNGYFNFMGGTIRSTISTNSHNFIIGGDTNSVSANYGGVLGGTSNTNNGDYSVILGGQSNSITNAVRSVVGGWSNSVTGGGVVSVFGRSHLAGSNNAERLSIFGGQSNTIGGAGANFLDDTTIIGGQSNTIFGNNGTNRVNRVIILGGVSNRIYSAANSGSLNTFILGGNDSEIRPDLGPNPSIDNGGLIGGHNNLLLHNESIIIGGTNVTSSADDTVYVPNLHVSGSLTGVTVSAFPFTGSAEISGSLAVTNVGSTAANISLKGGYIHVNSDGYNEFAGLEVGHGNTINKPSGNTNTVFGTGNTNNSANGGFIHGENNTINGPSYGAVVLGSYGATVNGTFSGVIAAESCVIGGNQSLVSGLSNNTGVYRSVVIGSRSSTTGVGDSGIFVSYGSTMNRANAFNTTVIGGQLHTIGGNFGSDCTIVGGTDNNIYGQSNTNKTQRNIILGGYQNEINAGFANSGSTSNAILGGERNQIRPDLGDGTWLTGSVIVGGQYNQMKHNRSVIVGGSNITSSAHDSVFTPHLVVSGSGDGGLLTMKPWVGSLPSAANYPDTFAVSGSKPYFSDGATWNALY